MTVKDSRKSVDALTHDEARRRHIPTAEYQSVMKIVFRLFGQVIVDNKIYIGNIDAARLRP